MEYVTSGIFWEKDKDFDAKLCKYMCSHGKSIFISPFPLVINGPHRAARFTVLKQNELPIQISCIKRAIVDAKLL